MKKIITICVLLLFIVAGVSYEFYLNRQVDVVYGTELIGKWRAVDSGVNDNIEFKIVDGKYIFDSFGSGNEEQGRVRWNAQINCPWTYTTNYELLIECNSQDKFYFDKVTLSKSGVLILDNTDKTKNGSGKYIKIDNI